MKYKAILVDDETWTRRIIRNLGRWEKYEIEIAGEASDGAYGLELIRRLNPDIVITDVCMPQMDGLAQIEQIRKENDVIQVIFISGYDDYSYMRNAMKLGAADYLLKPIKSEELNHQLMACTQRLKKLKEKRVDETFKIDFFNDEWAADYYNFRDDLAQALDLGNYDILKLKIKEMEVFLGGKIGSTTDKGNMISVYYMLINVLQRFVVKRGFCMEDIFEGKNTVFVFSTSCTVKTMLDFIRELYESAMIKVQELMKCRNRLDIEKVQKYLQECYQDGATLESVADVFFVSKEYLSKAFKMESGKCFTEYLTGLRMEKVKELITVYKVPIKDAGEQVGYIDQAHFYKTFKKYFGMTPGEMRLV